VFSNFSRIRFSSLYAVMMNETGATSLPLFTGFDLHADTNHKHKGYPK
jgi:hypothetical protein